MLLPPAPTQVRTLLVAADDNERNATKKNGTHDACMTLARWLHGLELHGERRCALRWAVAVTVT